MANLEARIEKLERELGQTGEALDIVVSFIRPEDRFCCGYRRIKTGLEVTQSESESDADFVVRAKAAGFGGTDHE